MIHASGGLIFMNLLRNEGRGSLNRAPVPACRAWVACNRSDAFDVLLAEGRAAGMPNLGVCNLEA